LTVPLPLPDPPVGIEIHEALLTAVQLQPVATVTAMLLDEAPAGADALVGEIEYVQGAAAWLIVNVWPPTVIEPDRALTLVFAATE
jgi:hypothetical protein